MGESARPVFGFVVAVVVDLPSVLVSRVLSCTVELPVITYTELI